MLLHKAVSVNLILHDVERPKFCKKTSLKENFIGDDGTKCEFNWYPVQKDTK